MADFTIRNAYKSTIFAPSGDFQWLDINNMKAGQIAVRAMWVDGKLQEANVLHIQDMSNPAVYRAQTPIDVRFDYFGQGEHGCSLRHGSSLFGYRQSWRAWDTDRIALVRLLVPEDVPVIRDLWRPIDRSGPSFNGWLYEPEFRFDPVRVAFREALA